MEWHLFSRDPMENRNSGLTDHNYYLVTHRNYKTQMKAKWHDGPDEHWEVFACPHVKGSDKHIERVTEYWYAWDPENPIIAWMEMPEIYNYAEQ